MSAQAMTRTSVRARRGPATSKRSRFVGFLVVAMLLAVVAAVLLPVYAGWRVVNAGAVDDRRATDAIVVLGAAQYNGKPSPVLEARLDHAKVLYNQAVAPRIVTVGGKQPGDRFTEAGAGLTYLTRRGIPAADVSPVAVGRDTKQSLTAVARIAKREGWRSVTLVSDPAHMARVEAIAHHLGFETHLSPTRKGDGTALTGEYVTRETAGLLAFALVQRWDTPTPLN
ncbi:MAG: YdcF family protein [Actinobacteria bacterium]|nr:YdcF family protein [Actinomycetota bacterium]